MVNMIFKSRIAYYLIVVNILFCIVAAGFGDFIVKTKNGLVKGYVKTSHYGTKYMSFEGIRYAKAPEKELRYRNPIPINNWHGVFVANETVQCAQFYPYTKSIAGQEDCLTVNVYVPKLKITGLENMDVIVLFASGGYYFGANFGPDILMERSIVFMTFNHRLNYLGFMSFGDKLVPGNYGLKDQVLLLKWVKNNIKCFGGNPSSVTLLGMGGGSSSVQYHYFTSLSKGLFHKTFIMSGSVLNPYAFHSNATRGLSDYIRKMDCERNTSMRTLRCLQEADLKKTLTIGFEVNEGYSPRASTVHVEEEQSEAFLLEEPQQILEEGRIHEAPQVIMMSLNEGLLVSGYLYNQTKKLNKEYKSLFPKYFQYSDTKTKDYTSERIKEYLGTITHKNYNKFTNLATVRLFGYGLERSAKYFAASLVSDCYFGVMSYKGENSLIGSLAKGYFDLGVGHGDIFPFFISSPDFTKLEKEDLKMSEVLVDTLVEFAKTGIAKINGKPWVPVSKEEDAILKFVNFISPKQTFVESKDIQNDNELLSALCLK